MPTEKQLADADRLLKNVDWSHVDAMSDEELRAAWAWDKDAVWPTTRELTAFDLVVPAPAGQAHPPKDAAE